MRISVSMLTPNAFSMRNAISGDKEERSFSSVDNAARVTPSALAAAVTESPSGSTISARTKPPGCGGFFSRKLSIISGFPSGSPRNPDRRSRSRSCRSYVADLVDHRRLKPAGIILFDEPSQAPVLDAADAHPCAHMARGQVPSSVTLHLTVQLYSAIDQSRLCGS